MADPKITKEVNGSKARFVYATEAGEAELTLSIMSDEKVIADHTGVPPEMEGQGIARKLLDALLEDARENGYRIVPLCPYVNAQRRKHPEWADLFTS